MLSLPASSFLVVFGVLISLPTVCLWVAARLFTSTKKEESGIVLGNPLEAAPLAPFVPVTGKPLVHLTRSLSGADIEGFILGLRHLPLQQTAPLLMRFIQGNDPALQLYAQGILQQGRDRLASRFHRLEKRNPQESRAASWLLETGLILAHPSLCSPTERPGLLSHLAALASARLAAAVPTPALLANAARVYLEAGMIEEAQATATQLPEASPLRTKLAPAIAHARHQKALA